MERLAKRFKQDFCVSRKRARVSEVERPVKRERLDYKNDWFLAIADNNFAEIRRLYMKDSSLLMAKTRRGITTLAKMVIFCDLPTIRFFLSLPRRDVNLQDDGTGLTPLMIAAIMGRDRVVALLLAQPDIDLSITNSRGKTAVDLAEQTLKCNQTKKSRGRRHIILGLLLCNE